MGWWFYDYVLKGEGLINWPTYFWIHAVITVKRLGGKEVTTIREYAVPLTAIVLTVVVAIMIGIAFLYAVGVWPEEWRVQ